MTEVAQGEGRANSDVGAGNGDGGKRPVRTRRGIVLGAACAVVAVACAVVAVLFYVGVLSPTDAAAKYGAFSYIYEDDVTTYVEGFKNQSGLGDATDEEWATFLAKGNMSPESVRLSAIDEALKAAMVDKRASELGITVTDEEIEGEIATLKSAMAFDDDAVWADTLAMYGQTEEGIHEKYRLDILKRKLCTQEVPVPNPSDHQVKEYIAYTIPQIEEPSVKHSYCFKMYGLDEAGSLEKMKAVQRVRDRMASAGPSIESFAAAVREQSDVEALRETDGGNGWNVDTSEYSDAYVAALAELGEGGLSRVFNDGDGYAFIWVDEVYELPQSADELERMDLAEMPDTLHQYFIDCEGRVLWQAASDDYLQSLVEAEDALIFPMPATVPYNVDMSLAE